MRPVASRSAKGPVNMRSPTPSLRLLELTELPVTVPVCVRDTPAAVAEGDDLSRHDATGFIGQSHALEVDTGH